jgi:hypothetical protein
MAGPSTPGRALLDAALTNVFNEYDEAIWWVRRLEFATDSKGHHFCNECGEDDVHAPGCKLDAFLRRVSRT